MNVQNAYLGLKLDKIIYMKFPEDIKY